MSLSEFRQGAVIVSEGDPLSHLSFITKGTVEAVFNGHPFRYRQGDMIGLCDLMGGAHSHTYTAISDVTVFSYPHDDFNTVDTLLRTNADIAHLLVGSMCRQISDFLLYWAALKKESDLVYDAMTEIPPQYEKLCKRYALASKKLPGLAGVTRFSDTDPIQDWIHDYYTEINDLDPALQKRFFYSNPGISSGFLRRGTEDIFHVLQACRVYQDHLAEVSKFFLTNDEHDLFSLVSELHVNSVHIKGADAAVDELMARLTGLMANMTGVDPADYQERLELYQDTLAVSRASKEETDAPAAHSSGLKQNLSDSLPIILSYSELPEELCNKFTRHIHAYTKLEDRSGSESGTQRLRKELTQIFYEVYQHVFKKTLTDPAPSTVIKMFLNFGYVDAALAGPENADFLYSIADSVKGDPENSVYTIREWLTAIYNGQKEPGRNEFDLDYAAYLREQKVSGKIDAKEETRLLADQDEKLRFELENVFPTVNKLTYGHISTFCPLFSDHAVQRKLEISRVTPSALKETLDQLLSIDFSAYYRETPYTNTKFNIPMEFLHVEIRPDIILTPIVGVRGVMWQEIEGRRRATPAHMFMPLFLQIDLKTLLIRLTAEFRWEMCKRVQGARWNDITDPSLTSEFCDYLQFYRNNREFSGELRDSIKEELTRARNNFKTVFVSNYAEWVLYESNAAPRLNKNVRRMLLTHCPFSAEIREKLMQNPIYAELLGRYNFKQQQRVQHVSRLIQRISNGGKPVPKELLDELEFAKS